MTLGAATGEHIQQAAKAFRAAINAAELLPSPNHKMDRSHLVGQWRVSAIANQSSSNIRFVEDKRPFRAPIIQTPISLTANSIDGIFLLWHVKSSIPTSLAIGGQV